MNSSRIPYSSDYSSYSSLPLSISDPAEASIWTLTVSGSGTTRSVILYNSANSKYLTETISYQSSNSNATTFTAAYSSGNYGTFSLKGASNYLGVNKSANYWKVYASTNLTATNGLTFYKKVVSVAYTVSFDAGSNGNCSTTSLTEASVGAGVTLPSCAANTNYTFVGWSTSSTPTSADAGVAGANYKPSSNCTLYAYYTYQAPSHDAKFFVNGQQYGETQSVAEGSAILFPSDPEDINNMKFQGWTKTQNYSNSTDAPSDMTKSANMGDADVTYYAVFATEEGGDETLLETVGFESSEGYTAATTYNSSNYTTGSTGSKWKINYGAFATSGAIVGSQSAQFRVYSSGGGYGQLMNTVAYSSDITKVEYSAKAANSNGQVKVSYSTNGSSWTDITTQSLTTTTTEYSAAVPVSGVRYIKFTAAGTKPSSGNYSIYVDGVKITAGTGTTYSDYCTSVSTKTTPVLSFSPATYNYTIGETFNAPELTNPQSVTVAYSSSETSVADFVDGALTVKAPGTTIITASFAGNETYNPASASYTLNVSAAPNKYTVTIESPVNGTLTVKKGETVINSGDEVTEGTTLSIECKPANEDYRLRNWQAVDGSTHTYTTTFTYEVTADVTIKANFELIPVYTIAFSVNGDIVQTEDLKEDAAVNVLADPADINGKKFTGWIETENVVDATPAYVTPSATAEKAVTYYAVFATQNGSGAETWNEVTDASTLTENDVIAIVSSEAVDYNIKGNTTKYNGYIAMGKTQNTNNRAGVVVSVADDVLTINDDVQQITLTKATFDKNTDWQLGVDGGYLYANNSDNNYLKTQETNDVNGLWNISITDGKATIYAKYSSYTRNYIRVNGNYQNSTTVSPLVTAYKSDAPTGVLASIYKKSGGATYSDYCTIVPEILTLVAHAGSTYYATFSNSEAVEFIDDETVVNTVSVDETHVVVTEKIDKQVPANTGVLISSSNATVHYNVISEATEVSTSNLLKPAGDDGITADAMAAANANCKFYRLAYNNYSAQTGLGFYYGAADGAAFSCKAGTAYLAVPNSQTPARGYSFDGETAIESAIAEQLNQGVMYDLQGRRAKAGQHGIFIVNGKKVVR